MSAGVWIGSVVAVLGVLISVVGIWIGFDDRRSERAGRRARARVTEVERYLSSRRTMHRPVFEFVAEDGRRVRKRSSNASSSPTHAVGDEVDVWYDPADPERSDIVGEGKYFSMLMTGIGAIFAVIGLVIVFISRLDW